MKLIVLHSTQGKCASVEVIVTNKHCNSLKNLQLWHKNKFEIEEKPTNERLKRNNLSDSSLIAFFKSIEIDKQP